MRRLSLIAILSLIYLFTLSAPSLAQMYWTSETTAPEAVVTSSESQGPKVGKLAQSVKSSPEKEKSAVEKKAAKPSAKKTEAKVPRACPFPTDAK